MMLSVFKIVLDAVPAPDAIPQSPVTTTMTIVAVNVLVDRLGITPKTVNERELVTNQFVRCGLNAKADFVGPRRFQHKRHRANHRR
ncbi:hypothetical protein B5X24_HaOG209459 [Helicoverpa armigera]|uniref:Uncharacterized protein n=1 Tax=Helicoverpa armigera TaxID=29058 RepID=A0A2W1BJT2_HELAM|nr:hypothetical protein B5X24_HaOG209459 [Helicoverpa armigera]